MTHEMPPHPNDNESTAEGHFRVGEAPATDLRAAIGRVLQDTLANVRDFDYTPGKVFTRLRDRSGNTHVLDMSEGVHVEADEEPGMFQLYYGERGKHIVYTVTGAAVLGAAALVGYRRYRK